MENSKDSTRLKRMANKFADSMENSFTKVGQKVISSIINDGETWLMSTYEKWKRNQCAKAKFETLQQYIEVNNETTQIGMEKKEIAVMWAMQKLSYSEEQIREVLNLANKAYLPKEEREK